MSIQIHQVGFIHWSGNFTSGNDNNGYYCRPDGYYVYMPVRVCSLSTFTTERAGDMIDTCGVIYDLNKGPTRYGSWNLPAMHMDVEYSSSHFLMSLIQTPKRFWPKPHQFAFIDEVREMLPHHNRHIGRTTRG